ncbi:MAG: hydroxymethylglutaryl-CoA reductase, degradative [Candidatus Micrarchaeota archaeon]|nr:hydroxymethylglutaryl-CoA reductase, degradative [Candidatus Micrarchaeota archaeon]
MKTSVVSEFYKKTPAERLAFVKDFAQLTGEEAALLQKTGALDLDSANRMIENVVGETHVPLGVATNFLINGKEYLVPMAIEEPSVVAAASNAAKLARPGGFTASADEPVMIGQIQLVGVKDFEAAKKKILENKKALIEFANSLDAPLVKHGGGARDMDARVIDSQRGKMLIIHLLVDCRDAMGANAVNTMSEKLAPKLEALTGGEVRLRIISNLAVNRMARAKTIWTKESLATKEYPGGEVIERVLDAYAFAAADPYRCATHNKGIMNGIDAVILATSNDWRAIEAGAHAYAALGGKYKPLTKYYTNGAGDLVGEIELPMAVGLIGGATKTHPVAQVCVKILGVKSAQELAQVCAAVGLAQNFAALRALATTGIQAGHMRLHARNIAVMAGAKGEQIDAIAARIADEKNVRVDRAKEILEEMKKK